MQFIRGTKQKFTLCDFFSCSETGLLPRLYFYFALLIGLWIRERVELHLMVLRTSILSWVGEEAA